MNRKAKNIIYWTVVGILATIFIVCFAFGSIKTIFGAGTAIYNSAKSFLNSIGLNSSDFYNYSPYICIGAGIILTFMFFKKFNTRVN